MSAVNQRKPKLEAQIATYQCPGDLSILVADEYIKRIEQHLQILRGMHVEGLLFSFKNVVKIDQEALTKLIAAFTNFHVKLRVFCGFSEYNLSQFNLLKSSIQETPLGLFKTSEVLALATGTSKLYPNSSILVHSDDPTERQAIASTLISNNYFVIMANSQQDFKEKILHRDRFDRVISQSFFGNMHEDITVTFEHGIFTYECKGVLNDTLSSRIKIKDFEARLNMGYKVFAFDLTRIFHMDKDGAYLFADLDDLAKPNQAKVCLVGLDKKKIDTNAYSILHNRAIWLYDILEDIYEDEDIIEMTSHRKINYTKGFSKDLISFIPQLSAASLQALQIFQIHHPEKSPSCQSSIDQLQLYKPIITTHITFHGDYEGELFFLFAQESTEMLIEHLLGDVDDLEGDDLLDAMSEFVNSVTGKLKSNLKKVHKSLQFSLPRSSAVLEDFISNSDTQLAVLTTFKCDGNPYYVAITSPIKPLS